ncbi:hypothetical protein [Flavobacterium sp.]|uniref:hypothetical protein n=1 Tax=Flavobacterium sp. TaxID=239 RepID=UPI0022C6D428|nr:hypothetical protein [Flavobacterium sp.]MCZ8091202.1 hypothetical protein [Flavobacterium sp.]
MNEKNPILNFRKKTELRAKKEELKKIESKNQNYSSMITKTRESIDMTEHS